ncbi:MAG TPA: L,D-transpeptidase family protein [Erythrobacter sp.]|nr:L,D-transpeptidase family protein [Erythrobacter sp.]
MTLRSFLPLALLAVAFPVAAQTDAREAADAAEQVAARASGTFEQVDPDVEMPRVTAGPTVDETAIVISDLLPLVDDAVTLADPDLAPRGPAVRMISAEVVQPLPVAAPAPARVAAASSDPFVIKSILPIEGTIRYGDWFWDESAAPTAGKLVITVDLEARVISAFRDGHEIGTAVTLLGTQKHPTPLGTFPVLNKSREHFSRKYDNAPMPFSLWLTNTGIAIHGSPVMNGYASHGCIGVPDEFAAKLFAATKRGDKVIITRGKMIGVGDKVL